MVGAKRVVALGYRTRRFACCTDWRLLQYHYLHKDVWLGQSRLISRLPRLAELATLPNGTTYTTVLLKGFKFTTIATRRRERVVAQTDAADARPS
jgi:hypothetical protein